VVSIISLIAIVVMAFVLLIRPQDLPPVEKPSPTAHLDERKAAIYEGLRDLQFEYRLGKLSDSDYQATKTDLQKQLAAVLAEMDKFKAPASAASAPSGAQTVKTPESAPAAGRECPHCGAKFERELKFCGECGKAMLRA
jgi:hypothetical protein